MSLELCYPARHERKYVLWGLTLIAAGLIFLADRLDWIELGPVWTYWPVIFVIIGLIDCASARSMKQIADGLFWVLLGAWIYVCKEHLWGWSFGKTWPIILVAVGASMIIDGLDKKRRQEHKESLS